MIFPNIIVHFPMTLLVAEIVAVAYAVILCMTWSTAKKSSLGTRLWFCVVVALATAFVMAVIGWPAGYILDKIAGAAFAAAGASDHVYGIELIRGGCTAAILVILVSTVMSKKYELWDVADRAVRNLRKPGR